MSVSPQASNTATQVFLAVAIGFFGVALGYAIGSRQSPLPQYAAVPPAPVAAVAPAAAPATGIGDETQITAYRNILAADPKNAAAAIQLGNLLYDAGRYGEAVPYYRQALALDAKNVNVSTDLGTALWYSGNPDDALKQYDVSLKIDSRHEPTLFNIGVVRLEGKKDVPGAIEAWQRLIAINPLSEQASKARQRLEEAQRRLVTFSTTRPADAR
jgi:tetratricopeptide (TPR) repeat protein